ncbi:hypothetical protein vseg_002539 [Gypsophila vaccaria]
MAIWSQKGGAMRKFQVKLKVMKLDGFLIKDRTGPKVAVEVKYDEGAKMGGGIASLYKKSQTHYFTKEVDVFNLGDNNSIEWNHDFHHVFILSNNNNNNSSMVYFNILYGKNEEPSSSTTRAKMQVIGKCGLDLGELASKMEPTILQRIPISLVVDNVAIEANLLVLVSLTEMKTKAHHSRTMSTETFTNSENTKTSLRRAKSHGPTTLRQENVKKNKMLTFFSRQLSGKSRGSNESEYVVVASTSRSGDASLVEAELGRTTSSEAQLDMAKKGGFWKWKRRKSMKKGVTPVIIDTDAEKSIVPGIWQTREIMSRDAKTKLNAHVFFASYDQRSEKAAGESACAAIVAVIAHRLQQNPHTMLTGPEFDQLIAEGSSEWRNLCKDDTNKDVFPDKHFDLETIIRAELRPLVVHSDGSHFGFFHPEEFDHLKDAKSFDKIWDDINENISDFESRVYIVRWNDHFFVMKVEAKANYIFDSLGERLYEGCNNAYILKFDESSVMYSSKGDGKGGEDKVICRGKECCREYMKRFLAAIPVRELKEQEAKGKTVEMSVLHRRLLIDFHLSTHSSSSVSPNTSPLFLGDEDLEVQI